MKFLPLWMVIQVSMSSTASQETFPVLEIQCQDFPHSPTPDRPSTITEVTEHSSGDQHEKRTSNSSEDFSTEPIIFQKGRKRCADFDAIFLAATIHHNFSEE